MPQKKKLPSGTAVIGAVMETAPKKQRQTTTVTLDDDISEMINKESNENKASDIDVQKLQVKTEIPEIQINTTSSVNKSRLTPTGSAMDNHPYARQAVIEVLHGVKENSTNNDKNNGQKMDEEKKNCDDDDFNDWWDKDSDEEDENENENDQEEDQEGKSKSKEAVVSIRLCDVIDRVAVEDNTWRYYVHYRDFNRRMDEWISMDRIVSPPSVGNAKARVIKREEEKKKRALQREKEKEEKQKAALEARSVDVKAPRASRRRSTINMTGSTAVGTGNNNNVNGNQYSNYSNTSISIKNTEDSIVTDIITASSDCVVEEGTRRTRLRRKSTADADDATVMAGNASADGRTHSLSDTVAILPVMAAEKGTVALPKISDSNTKVHQEHLIQTIACIELDEHEGLDEASLREHEEVTKVKNVAYLELGAHQMSTWYFSPLPKELLSERGFIEVLYVCEFTLRMFSRKSEIRRFQSRLPADRRHPPGNEIYRNGNLSMFEVDGKNERLYCQNLCYIAKLFLDHKTLYFDVDPFLFYVLCEVDERGFHPVGYFSKEKHSDVGYNLACILTFPSHQRKGYGRFLIAFSYELSKKEEKVGSPEKPMSDLGQQAYKPYWASTIVDFLLNQCSNASMSIMDISKMTSIMAEDIVFTLNQLSILKVINGVYFIAAEGGLLKTLAKKYPVKEPRVDATKLHWTPFVIEIKKDKFSIHSKKPSVDGEETRGNGGF